MIVTEQRIWDLLESAKRSQADRIHMVVSPLEQAELCKLALLSLAGIGVRAQVGAAPPSALAVVLTAVLEHTQKMLTADSLPQAHNLAVNLDVFVCGMLRSEQIAARSVQGEQPQPSARWAGGGDR